MPVTDLPITDLMILTQIDVRSTRRLEDEGDQEATRTVAVTRGSIRSFTARRDRPGTRLTFIDGGGFAVAESFGDVKRYYETGEQPDFREPVRLVTASSGDDVA